MPLFGNLANRILQTENQSDESIVYFIEDISPESLVNIFSALQRKLVGKTAVKISTGEPGGHNFLDPKLIQNLINTVNGTIVECNTAYPGKRNTVEDHMKVMKDHGFLDIATCDLMDAEGELVLPIKNGLQLNHNAIGSHFSNYDSMIVLSHFKGHQMAGFGGALKNMSIGIASAAGKVNIHTAGKSTSFDDAFKTDQNKFLESMADADKAVSDYIGSKNIAYINVANKLSIDCDCSDHPKDPEMKDIGIFASIDPVALDQACIDAIYNSKDEGKESLIKRIEEKNGIHIIESAEKIGLGKRNYRIIVI